MEKSLTEKGFPEMGRRRHKQEGVTPLSPQIFVFISIRMISCASGGKQRSYRQIIEKEGLSGYFSRVERCAGGEMREGPRMSMTYHRPSTY
jgi:hypothetical protein